MPPGPGFLHLDSPSRDSLASDVTEPVRPQVDAFVWDWIASTPLNRKWYFEQRDGNCRLMGSLAETVSTWRVAVAPFAERVAQVLWQTTRKSPRTIAPATRLTQRHKRESKGARSSSVETRTTQPQNICHGCGSYIRREANIAFRVRSRHPQNGSSMWRAKVALLLLALRLTLAALKKLADTPARGGAGRLRVNQLGSLMNFTRVRLTLCSQPFGDPQSALVRCCENLR